MVIAATLTLAGVLLGRKQVINQSRNVRLDEYYRECRVVASSIVTASREVYVGTPRIASVPEPPTSTPDKSGFVKRMEKFADQTGALSHALDSFHILVDDTQIREDATLLQQESRKLAKSVADFLDKAEKDSTFAVMRRRVPRLAGLPGFLRLWLVGGCGEKSGCDDLAAEAGEHVQSGRLDRTRSCRHLVVTAADGQRRKFRGDTPTLHPGIQGPGC